MDKLFLQVLNLSFTGSVVIGFVLASRILLRKAPKIFSYALWLVVLFRLLCPFSIETVFSLLPTKPNPIAYDIQYMATPRVDTGIDSINHTVNNILPSARPMNSVNPLQIWIFIGSRIWVAGIVALLTYNGVSLYRLRKRLQRASRYKDNIFLSDNIDTAFVLGIFHPNIYLPCQLSPTEREYILLHEKMHIKHLDHIVKLVSFMALLIHWFNPIVWIAFFVSGIDMEMTCDERVIQSLGEKVKADYSTSLLTLATGKRIIGGTPLTFGERETKERIKNVLHYKKPKFRVIWMAIIVVVALVAGLIVNPRNRGADPTDQKTEIAERDRADSQRKTNDPTSYSSEELWKARTKYIGNNAAIGKLIYLLPQPKEVRYDYMELQTAKEPYFVDIYYTIPEELFESYQNGSAESLNIFRKNALLILALADNAGGVRYRFTEGQKQIDRVITRIKADEILGKQVRGYGESPVKLQELMNIEIKEMQLDSMENDHTIKTITTMEGLFDIIMSSPKESSNPEDYIKAHAAEYQELINHGEESLKYCFQEFLEGGQTGLKGSLMESLCHDLLGAEDISFAGATGQAWFDDYLATVKTYQAKEGMAYVKQKMPKAYLLLIRISN